MGKRIAVSNELETTDIECFADALSAETFPMPFISTK
jgi:hypothetical protein